MKRWKKGVLLTFGVLLLLLFAVSRSYLTPDPIPGVTFSVEEGSVTAEGMTFTISNDTDAELTYGAEYRLEKRGLLGWRHLWENFLPAGWDAVGYFVSPKGIQTEAFSWTGRYGELSPGTYRMVRTYTLEGQDYSVAVEFAVSGS